MFGLALLLSPISGRGTQAQCTDCDGDGYAWPLDCNDAASSVHPGAAEVCDGLDNDCSGALDDTMSCDGTCDLPGKNGVEASIAQSVGSSTLEWTGTEYGIAWHDYRNGTPDIYFARLDTAGSPIGPATRVTTAGVLATSFHPALAWTGNEYGLAWESYANVEHEIYFSRLDRYGSKIGDDVRVTTTPEESVAPTLVWTGREYGLAWWEATAPTTAVLFSRLDPLGHPVGPQVRVDTGGGSYPQLLWTGTQFGIAWLGTNIMFTRLDPAGTMLGPSTQISASATQSEFPSLVWTGTEYGIAWVNRTVEAIYFARVGPSGDKMGTDSRITNVPGFSYSPYLGWTGREYGLAWEDTRNGHTEVHFVRIDASGARLGDELRLGTDSSSLPTLIWNGTGYEAAWNTNSALFLAGIGCACGDELCDGQDNDCDTLIDEELGQTTCGVGSCTMVIANCVDGATQQCIPGLPSVDQCDGVDNDCDGVVDNGDADQDGYTICLDCNDSSPSIHPGAVEVCNALDDNCNGQIDDDPAGLDADGDGIHNACDNCRFAYNPTQVDTDHDAVGNSCDNCLLVPNGAQSDIDADQRGDVCDNCPAAANNLQDDTDADSVGDVCDNCVLTPNRDQGDVNADFVGDICDLGDGLILIRLSDELTVEWQQEAGFEAFNLYRGDLTVLKGSGLYTQDPNTVPLAGRECGLADPYTFDISDPPVGKGVFFLVTGVHLGVESSLGTNSGGAQRPNANPCP